MMNILSQRWGADHVNEIARLCEFIRPDIGIITAVGPRAFFDL